MNTQNKYLKETTEYSSEDAKFMEMAINLAIDNIDHGGDRSEPSSSRTGR